MVNADRRRPRSPYFLPLVFVVAGVLVFLLYRLLAAFEIGGIGAPTDIGGGLIGVFGLGLVLIGLIALAVTAFTSRKR